MKKEKNFIVCEVDTNTGWTMFIENSSLYTAVHKLSLCQSRFTEDEANQWIVNRRLFLQNNRPNEFLSKLFFLIEE